MATPFGHTADGFETQFGTNHLGHFVLVNRIASLMGTGSRLVNLASSGHRFSNVDLDDPNFEQRLMNRSSLMVVRRRRTSCLPLPSMNGIASVVYVLRRCIREASRPNWAATWTRAN